MSMHNPEPQVEGKTRLVGRAAEKKKGLTLEQLEHFVMVARRDGYSYDSPIVDVRVSWRGRLTALAVRHQQ